ncbi:MAG: TauD/TfdA family dioxygenase [Hyphomicrobiaceae bacterium]|nr:TauD/TfdA family dioxygenase [Hyphomicrobiaceae bacterium]
MKLTVRKLHPLFVAEVDGVDLSRPIDDASFSRLDAAINEHSVLVFHGQSLDDAQLLALGHRFGSIAKPRTSRAERRIGLAEIADISNLDARNELRRRDDSKRLDSLGNQLWHSDASFRPISGALSMLHAHVIPSWGGETEFADLRAAYDALDARLRATVEGLVAVHSIFASRGQLGHTDYTPAERAALPDVRHPIVRTHPGSGRKTLYLGAHVDHIDGWPKPEGKLLVKDLMEHATQPRFRYTHTWQVGDLVIWDNRCTLHRGRPYDDGNEKRDLRRVTTQDMQSVNDNPEVLAALEAAGMA